MAPLRFELVLDGNMFYFSASDGIFPGLTAYTLARSSVSVRISSNGFFCEGYDLDGCVLRNFRVYDYDGDGIVACISR